MQYRPKIRGFYDTYDYVWQIGQRDNSGNIQWVGLGVVGIVGNRLFLYARMHISGYPDIVR